MKQTKFLFTLLMAIVMMAMSPMKTWADNVASVTIGGVETKYSNIEDALTAAVNAGTAATMKMLADVEISSFLEINKFGCNVTMDLNGHKIESVAQAPLINLSNGSLTIIDSSTDKTGTIKSNNYDTISSMGSITIHGGNFISVTGNALFSFYSTANVYGGRFITEAENKPAVWADSNFLPDGYSFYNAMTGRKVEFMDYTGVIDENNDPVKDVIVMKDALEINGNEAFTCPVNVTPASVKFNRSITMDGGKYSFIVPFDIPAEKAATLGKFYTYEKYENETVYFAEETEGVQANIAYFFAPAKDITSISLNSAKIKATTSMADATNPSAYGLYGTYKKIAVPEGAYGYATSAEGEDKFVRAGTGSYVNAFRCYLWLGSGASASKANAIFGFDEATGINAEKAERLDLNAPMYNLRGQRITSPQKGEIYIMDGKKVMFK